MALASGPHQGAVIARVSALDATMRPEPRSRASVSPTVGYKKWVDRWL